jgi:small subunit ribosomal protein S2
MELEKKDNLVLQSFLTREKLAVAGVQFGHPVSKRHPKMQPFIYGVRKSAKHFGNKMHLINLLMTLKCIEKAYNFLINLKAKNGIVLMVGIKKQTKNLTKELAQEVDLPYITGR